MILKTNTPLIDLAGKELKDSEGAVVTLGRALANVMIAAQEGGKMKLYALSTKMYKDKSVDLDDADLALVKRVVSTSTIYNALVLGQIELVLENLKEDKKEN